MQATREQLDAVEAFGTGDHLRINAFAGTGKTTTLTLLAQQTARRGMYLAFNKKTASEAQAKFPSHVACSTVHSLAYRGTPNEYKHNRKMTETVNANALAQELGLRDGVLGGFKLTARSQGHLILRTLRQFMQGDHDTIRPEDVHPVGRMKMLEAADQERLAKFTVERAHYVWERMCHPSDKIPLGHDGYLKLWALRKPRLAADFILLDEAQDTNPVVLGVLSNQSAQIVYVGDRHQQIYEWRGAVNAMERIPTPQETFLTTSFRFGPEIAAAASNVLAHLGEKRALQGNPAIKSYLAASSCSTILARTNASVMTNVIAKMAEGYAVHVTGGVDEILRMLYAVSDLKRGHPSELQMFFGFVSWNEVVEFSKTEEGEDLRTFVGLVEQHGEEKLIGALKKTEASESTADIIVSTAHKAKGREWNTVELADDFLKSRASEAVNGEPHLEPSEVRLFYVALTRGREAVDVSPASLGLFNVVPTGPRPGGEIARRSKAQLATAADASRPVSPVFANCGVQEVPPVTAEEHLSTMNVVAWHWWVVALAVVVLCAAALRSGI